MYLDILKNPIVLGVLFGAITYLYLMWSVDKKDPKSKKEVSIFTPLVVAAVVSIIAYVYFNYTSSDTTVQIPEIITTKKQLDIQQPAPTNYNLTKDITSDSPTSFHLIRKGINVPNNIVNIPDVFIETTY